MSTTSVMIKIQSTNTTLSQSQIREIAIKRVKQTQPFNRCDKWTKIMSLNESKDLMDEGARYNIRDVDRSRLI